MKIDDFTTPSTSSIPDSSVYVRDVPCQQIEGELQPAPVAAPQITHQRFSALWRNSQTQITPETFVTLVENLYLDEDGWSLSEWLKKANAKDPSGTVAELTAALVCPTHAQHEAAFGMEEPDEDDLAATEAHTLQIKEACERLATHLDLPADIVQTISRPILVLTSMGSWQAPVHELIEVLKSKQEQRGYFYWEAVLPLADKMDKWGRLAKLMDALHKNPNLLKKPALLVKSAEQLACRMEDLVELQTICQTCGSERPLPASTKLPESSATSRIRIEAAIAEKALAALEAGAPPPQFSAWTNNAAIGSKQAAIAAQNKLFPPPPPKPVKNRKPQPAEQPLIRPCPSTLTALFADPARKQEMLDVLAELGWSDVRVESFFAGEKLPHNVQATADKIGIDRGTLDDLLHDKSNQILKPSTILALEEGLEGFNGGKLYVTQHPELIAFFPEATDFRRPLLLSVSQRNFVYSKYVLANLLVNYRMARGVSRVNLSRKLGMNEQAVRSFETILHRLVDPQIMLKVADILAEQLLADAVKSHEAGHAFADCHFLLPDEARDQVGDLDVDALFVRLQDEARRLVYLHSCPEVLKLFKFKDPATGKKIIPVQEKPVSYRRAYQLRKDLYEKMASLVLAKGKAAGLIDSNQEHASYQVLADVLSKLSKGTLSPSVAYRFVVPVYCPDPENLQIVNSLFPEITLEDWFLQTQAPVLRYFMGEKKDGKINTDFPEAVNFWKLENYSDFLDVLLERIRERYGSLAKAGKESGMSVLLKKEFLVDALRDSSLQDFRIAKMAQVLGMDRKLLYFYFKRKDILRIYQQKPVATANARRRTVSSPVTSRPVATPQVIPALAPIPAPQSLSRQAKLSNTLRPGLKIKLLGLTHGGIGFGTKPPSSLMPRAPLATRLFQSTR